MPIVLTAWAVQLEVDDAADPRVEEFLVEYIQGPQTPEPGAACSGGSGPPRESTCPAQPDRVPRLRR